MTRRDTFTHLQSWLDDVQMHGNDLIKICLVANKADLEGKRTVSREEAESWARDNGLLYCEASAKSGKNVEEVSSVSARPSRASLRGIVAKGQRS